MPSVNIGYSNLARAQPQTQRDRDGALTSIPGSNLLYGKRDREEGIFYKEGEDYSLIRGKRTLTGTAYYRVGSEWKRNKEVTIDSTIPKEISLYENDRLIYKGGVKDGLYHGHGTIYKNGKPIFEGNFENGKKWGEGCEFDDNGLFIKREYKNDQATGISSEEQEFRKSIDRLKRSYEKDLKPHMADTTYCDFIVLRKRDPKYQESPLIFYGYVTKQGARRVFGKEFKDTGYDLFEGVYDEQGRYCYGTLWCDPSWRFEGSFENGKMKHGKLFCQKILLYEGDVSADGQMYGEGRLYYTSKMNTTPYVQYEGSFQNGKPEGFGKVFYNLENETEKRLKYCGYFKNGLFDGRGIYFSKDLSYCCGSSLELNKADSKRSGTRIDKNEVEDIMKACSNMSKNEFDSLSYKYGIADMNPKGGWKEGQLDGYVRITSKHTPSYLVEMIDHKPTFVWDMMIDNKKYSGDVIIDDNSAISLLYFKITFTTYNVEFDNWKYEIIRDERGELSGSIYYHKKLFYCGPIKNFEPHGEGQLFDDKGQKYADGTFVNGRITLCRMETNGYKYELRSTYWDWKKPESWRISGTGKVYKQPETYSNNKDNQVLLPEYYLIYEGNMIEGKYEGKGAGMVLINKESKCSFEGEWHDNKIYKGQLRSVKDGRIIEGEWINGEIDPHFVYTIRLNDKDYKKGTLFKNYGEHDVTECKIDGKEYKLERRGSSIYCEVRNENEILYEGFVMKKANLEHAMSNSGMIPNRFLKWEYIPNGLGKEYEKGKLKYSGNYVFGKRDGNGKEYKEDGTPLLFEGNWKNDQYDNGAYYQNDLKIECNFGELSQIQNILTYKNAKVYKNDILLYQGSINNVGNELKPMGGTWYISFFHANARYAVKSSELRNNRIHIKNSVFEYNGCIKREDSDFNMSIEGKGELIYNGFAYNGKFEGVETISECTLSRVISNGQRVSLFYGEVKSLIMYAGILFDSRSISEGLFANNVLVNGYVFDSAGYCIRNVGDVSGYERMYSEKKYKYRELFRRNHGVILYYPTSQSTTMNQSICNLAKPGNQPTSNLATRDNAYEEVKKIANGSAVVNNEGGKCFIRMK